MNDETRSGPLSGVRILDFTSMVSGPGATAILADQGAEIIKVEPLGGDTIRTAARNERGLSAPFIVLNRGKRSLAVNLKSEAGRAIVRRLLPTVDVLVHNFRPGAIDRMGFAERSVRAEYPNIIFVAMSGFGHLGPLANRRVYDPLVQAMCGMAALQRQTEQDPPQIVRTIVPDTVMGYATAQAITAALLAKANGKGGQSINISMLGVMISFMWPSSMMNHTFIDWRDGEEKQPSMQNVVYATTDRHIAINILTDSEWHGLCRALKVEEWKKKAQFSTPQARQMNAVELRNAIADVVQRGSSSFWLDRLVREDVPCAPVLTQSEIFEDEQVRTNGMIREINHPAVGRMRQPAQWADFGGTPALPNGIAPLLGADNREILSELNYPEDEIEQLIHDGVVGPPQS